MRPSVASDPAAAAARKEFAADVEYYLALHPRQLPSRYFYDALGSALFDAICQLPWYGITRAESGLLRAHGRDILRHVAPLTSVVELGPGNGSKLLTFLETDTTRSRHLRLHLIDVSRAALDASSHTLAVLRDVDVVTHHASYEAGLVDLRVEPASRGRTLALFLGSNIGNFDRPGAAEFLLNIRRALTVDDALLLGADLVKPEHELLAAYDDPLGVTAAFNRNLLVRINRELGGTFDIDAFAHRAVWNAAESRVEMHLVSTRRQTVRVAAAAELAFTMEQGETIWTESSYKYDPPGIASVLKGAGFQASEQWIDRAHGFALTLARAV
jgi:L-histidine N-alpha-methyltransferase